jgi:hypothetical protein
MCTERGQFVVVVNSGPIDISWRNAPAVQQAAAIIESYRGSLMGIRLNGHPIPEAFVDALSGTHLCVAEMSVPAAMAAATFFVETVGDGGADTRPRTARGQ